MNLAKEVAAMEQMTVGELHDRYVEVFGEQVRSRHRQSDSTDRLALAGQCRRRIKRKSVETRSGTGRGCGCKRDDKEPKPPSGAPDRPDWLGDEAKAAWDRLVPYLQIMGVLSRIDENAMTRYCRLWSRWRKAEEFIEKRGDMFPIKDEAGNVKCFQQWPQVAIAAKLAAQLTRIEQEFGMTPQRGPAFTSITRLDQQA